MKNMLAGKADPIVKKIYKYTLLFPRLIQSSIGDQLRRSSLSIVLNIVESGGRKGVKEKYHLLNIAFGSLKETQYLLELSYNFDLIKNPTTMRCIKS